MVTTFIYKPSLWGSMHAISIYRGNRLTNTQTHKQTHRQDRLQYTALLSLARSVMRDTFFRGIIDFTWLSSSWRMITCTFIEVCAWFQSVFGRHILYYAFFPRLFRHMIPYFHRHWSQSVISSSHFFVCTGFFLCLVCFNFKRHPCGGP